jgi:hypothetical protein
MIVYTDRYREPFEIDEDDYEIVRRFTWRIAAGYVQTSLRCYEGPHRYRTICLHTLLLGPAPAGLQWDHKDRNKMNNRRSNLNAVTVSENGKNKDPYVRIKPGISGIEGIHKNRNKWVVYIPPTMLPPGEFIRIGRFSNLEDAIKAQMKGIEENFL